MKVQVSCSDEMVEQIDKYAKLMGVSRSALCSMLIGQGIMGFNKSFEIIDGIGQRLESNLQQKVADTKTKEDVASSPYV